MTSAVRETETGAGTEAGRVGGPDGEGPVVPAVLRSWIATVDMTTASVDGAPRDPFTHVPDPVTRVVVRTEPSGRRDVLVIGPRTRASYHPGKHLDSCVQLRLRAGTARPLLGVPAVDLVGRAIPLGDLPSAHARRLAAGLLPLEPESVVPHLAEVLPDRLAPSDDSRAALLRRALAAMSPDPDDGHPSESVGELAHGLGVSERQLRNLFAEGVGVSPKHYARIARVRHILTRRSPAMSWAELAVSTGYYDQSHMTADFRALMGVPPASFFTGRLPAVQPCQAFGRA
ncbi:helix-turn-helix domain-containing protein [Streptomyces acidicola]|uniref:helix-turn-helix domain-containing protein n=1 Tax=Streptomyces acidicola TaxID=2596892 RepID=UPI00382D7333